LNIMMKIAASADPCTSFALTRRATFQGGYWHRRQPANSRRCQERGRLAPQQSRARGEAVATCFCRDRVEPRPIRRTSFWPRRDVLSVTDQSAGSSQLVKADAATRQRCRGSAATYGGVCDCTPSQACHGPAKGIYASTLSVHVRRSRRRNLGHLCLWRLGAEARRAGPCFGTATALSR
jgi:hypothetical protein